MAGSIIISNDLILSVSTWQFDCIESQIRSELKLIDQSVFEKVYSPLDEGGMNFISAESLSANEFGDFVQAVMKAVERVKKNPHDQDLLSLWEDLLGKLRADARFFQN